MHSLVILAKLAVENYVKEGKKIEAETDLSEKFSRIEFAEMLKKRAGVFVTIEMDNNLRGCIGTYLPTRINIAEEIIGNAIAAATEDSRFGSIKIEELPYLSYVVYVLSEPKPVEDIKELNPKKFGIIVKTGPFTYPNQENVVFDGTVPYKTGVLLPDLEGINTPEQQLSIACQKANIKPAEEKIFIYKFTVEKHQ